MRLLISTVIVVCELSAALADDMEAAPPSIRLEMHDALRSEFHFVASPLPELAPPPAWSTHPLLADLPPPASGGPTLDPEVVRMAPVIVRGDAVFQPIESALKAQDAQIKVQKEYARFGIGVHEVRLGKLHLGVLTELGIPVLIGLSW